MTHLKCTLQLFLLESRIRWMILVQANPAAVMHYSPIHAVSAVCRNAAPLLCKYTEIALHVARLGVLAPEFQ